MLGALVVLFGVGVVATRPTGGVLAPAPPDRADADLPDGPLTADDLHRVRFGLTLRGYRMSEVDAVLDRAAEALAAEQQRVRRLEAALGADGVSLEKP
jgi:DivIVA domain-containing protein